MTHKLFAYRRTVAAFLFIWTWSIIISGVVFMHKEVTSTGEIVTHIHPYNLGEEHHHEHHSDAEIHFLDIVFQGSYLNWNPMTFDLPIRTAFNCLQFGERSYSLANQDGAEPTSRGPPAFS